jgi:excisionase family DNA binding protein
MTKQLSDSETWLSLREAAKQLNVHPTTLRRWANNGDIPVLLTPGGHRRFAASAVTRFAQERHGWRTINNIGQVWADQALSQTRKEIIVRQDQKWLVNLDDETRAHNRSMGQQLLGLTLQYLSANDNDKSILMEAQKIGQQYGRNCLRMGLPLSDALQASLFFRDMLIESALKLPENAHIRPEANLRLLRRINTLLNVVHLAVAEVYDATYTDHLSRT